METGVFVAKVWQKVWPVHEACESRWCAGTKSPPGVSNYQEQLEVSLMSPSVCFFWLLRFFFLYKCDFSKTNFANNAEICVKIFHSYIEDARTDYVNQVNVNLFT